MPRASAIIVSTTTCPVKALVEATPISGPTCMYVPVSDSLAIELPTPFTMPYTKAPCDLACCMAARVSAVSPDCEMATTTSSGSMTGSLYLNSLAYATSTGILQKCSSSCLPIKPACHDVPQLTITMRRALSNLLLLEVTAESITCGECE